MRGFRRPAILAITTVLAFCGVYLAGIHITGNFHQVLPGELYRSAQPTGTDIADFKRKFGIRTIVNLRGKNDAQWYRDEVEAAKREGLVHIDFRMSASRALTTEQSLQLVALLRDAPKPILIHCKSGADRTGLASVIYSSQVAGIDAETAERQLSIVFGHVAIPFLSSAFAMDESWESFEAALRLPG